MARSTVCLLAGALLCCDAAVDAPPVETPARRLPAPDVEASAPRLKRLTQAQYLNSVRDVFEADVVLPSIEPDVAIGGLFAIGATETSISPWGVEQYEAAAFAVAEQILADHPSRAERVGCAPSRVDDEPCAEKFLARIGARAWRRGLTEVELTELVSITTTSARALADFHEGLSFGIAAILQSPHFLYRVELGDGEAGTAYTSHEMASRLAFLFWNAGPDTALLAAADAGELLTDDSVRSAAERLLASERARVGVRTFFEQRFQLYRLASLAKDPKVFTHAHPELGDSAMTETLMTLERVIFDEDADYRGLFTSDRTFVDRRLAALYGVRAPTREGFGAVELTREGGRRGLLGQAAFLALNAHAVSSSPTLRGKFVREVLLCDEVQAPPVNANTAIPEVTPGARTMRERLAQHLEDPGCASCHLQMDPIGLGLERFDGIGRRRSQDNGVTIDASGDLDGAPFSDAWSLAAALADHPDVPRCLVSSMYRYAIGIADAVGEAEQVDDLTLRFARAGYSVKALLVEIALSPGFRYARSAS